MSREGKILLVGLLAQLHHPHYAELVRGVSEHFLLLGFFFGQRALPLHGGAPLLESLEVDYCDLGEVEIDCAVLHTFFHKFQV